MLTARILVVLGVLLAALSLLAGYVRFQALDTPTVKKTAGKLIADDQIRDQVATSLVDQLYANVDVPAELAKRLPPDQKGLAGPLSAALREFSNRAAQRLLERPEVQALWVDDRHPSAYAADQRPRGRHGRGSAPRTAQSSSTSSH